MTSDPKSAAEGTPIEDWPHHGGEESESAVVVTVDATIREEYREAIMDIRLPRKANELPAMVSADSPARASCCPHTERRLCCGTEEKVECCGTSSQGGCGCR